MNQTNTPLQASARPGVVLLAAVLNFIACGASLFISGLLVFIIILGNSMNLQQRAIQTVSDRLPQLTSAAGAGVVLVSIFLLALALVFYNLFVGIALLKAKKIAWFLQVAASIVGLLGFPVWTILNGIILFLFFQKPVRDYFKV